MRKVIQENVCVALSVESVLRQQRLEHIMICSDAIVTIIVRLL